MFRNVRYLGGLNSVHCHYAPKMMPILCISCRILMDVSIRLFSSQALFSHNFCWKVSVSDATGTVRKVCSRAYRRGLSNVTGLRRQRNVVNTFDLFQKIEKYVIFKLFYDFWAQCELFLVFLWPKIVDLLVCYRLETSTTRTACRSGIWMPLHRWLPWLYVYLFLVY